MEADFGGYLTRYGVTCTDGRRILQHAFKASDGSQIPLVWQHQHDAPTNVLGYLDLQHRDDGVYAKGFFNDTPTGLHAKAMVAHKDVVALSVYANGLVQKGNDVLHGNIREGSLVLAGANPGAYIDFVNVVHADGDVSVADDEAIIYTDELIVVEGVTTGTPPVPAVAHQSGTAVVPAKPDLAQAVSGLSAAMPDAQPASEPPTVNDVINSLNDQQREVVYALIGAAVAQGGSAAPQDGSAVQQAATTGDDPATSTDKKGDANVTRNVFDQTTADAAATSAGPATTLSHSDIQDIFASARKGGSLKEAVEEYALAHGITAIDLMFPDARAVTDTPDWVSRRQEWVADVLSKTHHTPFSRIKNLLADITLDEARARGYVKGAMKREEWFAVSRRITTPQTVYKKQRLDRDDIIDITDFDVVQWLKAEMRVMLDEEVARAVLVGDGRDVADPDKISETNVRPIVTDSDVYTTTVNIAPSSFDALGEDGIVDGVLSAMQYFMGTGQPTLYAARSWITKMLLAKDTLGRRLHATLTELADAMGVGAVVPVDVMETMTSTLIGIIVNLSDYTLGTDRGGEVNFFDDFDIDYNKFTYLYETRLSGALTKYKSALVISLFSGAGGVLANPTPPTFVKATGVVTIPTMANVTYVSVNDTTGAESAALTAGAQAAIAQGASVHIRAKAAATFAFASNAVNNWTFQRPLP
jgi:hypothetical protein